MVPPCTGLGWQIRATPRASGTSHSRASSGPQGPSMAKRVSRINSGSSVTPERGHCVLVKDTSHNRALPRYTAPARAATVKQSRFQRKDSRGTIAHPLAAARLGPARRHRHRLPGRAPAAPTLPLAAPSASWTTCSNAGQLPERGGDPLQHHRQPGEEAHPELPGGARNTCPRAPTAWPPTN